MTKEAPVVLWFRGDLRLDDHPALPEASRHAKHVLALYVLEDEPSDFGFLEELDERLGGRLMLVRGEPATEVVRAARTIHAAAVYVGSRDPRDADVAKALSDNGIGWVEVRGPRPTEPSLVDWVVPPYSAEIPPHVRDERGD